MVKFIDMSLVVDKSLDVYCELTCERRGESDLGYKNASGSTKRIFSEILQIAVDEYSPRYDKVLFAVPCFPITRMDKLSIMTRFICTNSELLYDIGVSYTQFLEAFERFLPTKCKHEYMNKIGENAYILNNRSILLNDWKSSVINHFGSSLVDDKIDSPFDINPGIIVNFESDLGKFTELPNEEKFKIDMIIENLTKN